MKIDTRVFVVMIIFIGVLCYFSYSVYFLNQLSIYAENGWLENTQVVTLILSCITFLFPVISQKREDKLILVFFSFLCFSFVLREVDVENLDIINSLKFIGHGVGRNIMLSVGFIAIGIYVMLNYKYYKKLAKEFIISLMGRVIIIAGFLLCISYFFEHHSSILHHVFLEEAFELSGYVLILIVALIFSKNKLSCVTPDKSF